MEKFHYTANIKAGAILLLHNLYLVSWLRIDDIRLAYPRSFSRRSPESVVGPQQTWQPV
jgi:hypothetical protein